MDGSTARRQAPPRGPAYRSAALPRLVGRRGRRSPIRRIVAGSSNRATPVIAAAEVVARFRARVRLTSVDPARNRYRFYSLTWQPMLFGGGALIRTWGRMGTKGRTLEIVYPDRASAQPAVEQLLRQRLRRGYQVVEVY